MCVCVLYIEYLPTYLPTYAASTSAEKKKAEGGGEGLGRAENILHTTKMLDPTIESGRKIDCPPQKKKKDSGLIEASLKLFAQENIKKEKRSLNPKYTYHKHTHNSLPPLIN